MENFNFFIDLPNKITIFLQDIINNYIGYILILIVAFILYKLLLVVWSGFCTNFFKKRFEKWKEKRDEKKKNKQATKKTFFAILSQSPIIEITGAQRAGKTTLVNCASHYFIRQKIEYLKKNEFFYKVTQPQMWSWY